MNLVKFLKTAFSIEHLTALTTDSACQLPTVLTREGTISYLLLHEIANLRFGKVIGSRFLKGSVFSTVLSLQQRYKNCLVQNI